LRNQLLQRQPWRRLPLHLEREPPRVLLSQDVRRRLRGLELDHRLPLTPVRELLRDHAVLLRVTTVETARGAERPDAPPLVARISTLAIDPFAISAVGLAAAGAAVALTGLSLPALTIAVALLAGWSSAWSP
jgi:hypothetical protein